MDERTQQALLPRGRVLVRDRCPSHRCVLVEWLTAPANQTESINIWYTPLLVLFMLAPAVSAIVARFRFHA